LPIPLVAPMMIAFFIYIKVDKQNMNANFLQFYRKFNPFNFLIVTNTIKALLLLSWKWKKSILHLVTEHNVCLIRE